MVSWLQTWGDSCHSCIKAPLTTVSPMFTLCIKTNKLQGLGLINDNISRLHSSVKLPGTIPKTFETHTHSLSFFLLVLISLRVFLSEPLRIRFPRVFGQQTSIFLLFWFFFKCVFSESVSALPRNLDLMVIYWEGLYEIWVNMLEDRVNQYLLLSGGLSWRLWGVSIYSSLFLRTNEFCWLARKEGNK